MPDGPRTQFDALVVGAGPAGSTVALLLARAGWSVALIERKRFPRRKASGLGARLTVLLVQLPPSLAFEPRSVQRFFSLLAELSSSAVVCDPRHASWFTPQADGCLVEHHIGRAAADPVRWPAAATPGGWLGPAGDGVGAVIYCRWHGAPRTY